MGKVFRLKAEGLEDRGRRREIRQDLQDYPDYFFTVSRRNREISTPRPRAGRKAGKAKKILYILLILSDSFFSYCLKW